MNIPLFALGETKLTHEEQERYSRHIVLPGIGLTGQTRLKSARVLVIGAGGLGSPVLLYLAAAGVGGVGIVDGDVVETSNLQRQVIHGVAQVGRKKVESACEAMLHINPHLHVECYPHMLSDAHALSIIKKYDVVVDATDNFATRYLINDACVLAGKPYVWGAIFQFEGQVSVFWEQAPEGGVNYRDLYPFPPRPEEAPTCGEGGVLGALCGWIGSMMAIEVIKLLTGVGQPLLGTIAIMDALTMQSRMLRLKRDPNRVAILNLMDYHIFCGTTNEEKEKVDAISVTTLSQWLEEGVAIELIDVRELGEWQTGYIDGARHIPKSDLLTEAIWQSLDKQKPIVLYCKSGVRSYHALLALKSHGFSALYNLTGGILAWVGEGQPILKPI